MTPNKPMPTLKSTFDTPRLLGIADRAQQALGELRNALLDPWPRKIAPTVSGSRLARLLRMEMLKLNHAVRHNRIPNGAAPMVGRVREYYVEQVQQIMREHGPYKIRQPGQRGVVVSVGNFKGGVGKTTNAVAIAQGLTLHGHKVLLIDLDPQASTTTLMGYVPDAEVDEGETVMGIVFGDHDNLDYAIRPTYWPNLDFIPSSPSLFGADFYLPNKQASQPDFEFWNILESVFDPIREKYDVIVIDTPPTLSYLAIASFMCTDGMIVPVPPETLDYASSTQFFRQFAELFKTMADSRGVPKEFQFVKLVLSKVKDTAAQTQLVRGWLKSTYPELVASAEVLESDVVKNASASFSTIYDIRHYEGAQKTYQRALDAFDSLVDEIEDELTRIWTADMPTPRPAPAQEQPA